MFNWRHWAQVFEFTVAGSALTLNGMVVWLCVYKIAKNMKAYRAMLIFAAIVDSITAVLSALTQIWVVDHETKMIFVLESPFLPATHLSVIVATSVWCVGIYGILVSVCMQFVNRLNIICWKDHYSWKQIGTFFFGFFFWTWAHCFNIGFVCNEHDDPKTTRELAKNPLFRNSTIPPYIAGDTHALKMILQLVDVQLIVSSAYLIIFYCGYRIQRKLREDRSMLQASTIKTQKQMSRILTIQAIIPLVFVIFPVGLADFLPIINVSFDYLPLFVKLTVGITPLLNPLVVLFIVPRFRSSMVRLLRLNSLTPVTPATSTNDISSGKIHPLPQITLDSAEV